MPASAKGQSFVVGACVVVVERVGDFVNSFVSLQRCSNNAFLTFFSECYFGYFVK